MSFCAARALCGAPWRAPRSAQPETMKSALLFCLVALVRDAHAQSCGANRKCDDCTAGCDWINRWDSTGWHCIDDDNFDNSKMGVISFGLCQVCSGKRTCAECNSATCGWCKSPSGDDAACLEDSDENKAFCKSKGYEYTGMMDDCP